MKRLTESQSTGLELLKFYPLKIIPDSRNSGGVSLPVGLGWSQRRDKSVAETGTQALMTCDGGP